MLATICYFTQNGYPIYDDIAEAKKPIPGTEKFGNLVDTDKPVPLTVLEQSSLADMTAEFSTSCYAGVLMLQAMGLGGYIYEGVDRHTILEASGDRVMVFIVNMESTDMMPAIAEPLFQGFGAKVEFHPVMVFDDLKKAIQNLGKL
jgi:hypothetical protein